MRRVLILILLLCSTSFAYLGSLHKKYMRNLPTILSLKGADSAAKAVRDNNKLFQEACASPDQDYPELKLPKEWLPEQLKKYNTSLAKWEHTLPDDCPDEIEKVFEKACKELLHKDFKYADETIVDWYNKAKAFYKNGELDSAYWHLGRCCHLIEDITVPMHCKVSSGLIDAWNTIHHQEPNHEKFERLAGEQYKPMTHKYDIKPIKNLEALMHKIAIKSRKRMRLCNNIGCTKFTKCPLTRWITWFVPCLAEDYEKALKISYQQGEEMTVRLIAQFFIDVKK